MEPPLVSETQRYVNVFFAKCGICVPINGQTSGKCCPSSVSSRTERHEHEPLRAMTAVMAAEPE